MSDVYICDYVRTAIGRFGGSLSTVRTDDLAAIPIKSLMERNESVDWENVNDVYYGCANQAGEDNRNVARMASLLAGLPINVPGATINRLCGSGMDAILTAARVIKSGEADIILAGGVESMTRAPFVMPKSSSAFSRNSEIFDTTIGWRFINKQMKKLYGTDSMPETGENVAEQFNVSRKDQDKFAFKSQQKAKSAIESGRFEKEIVPVSIPQRKGSDIIFQQDEHPRLSSLDKLAQLATPFKNNGSITAGNASGVNDGAACTIVANELAIKKYNLQPIARIVSGTTVGVEPRIMGIGPFPAAQKVLKMSKWVQQDLAVIEINEAFASQGLASLRLLGISDDDPRINPNGGAIALGHPLGMSGTRITGTAAIQLAKSGDKALATMCIGVGQGIAITIEKV
ncbi:MAG: 3-oxoadipyl-CoA thiolase [Paracoccaceae bacterium]|nr:3-oxoadipyl-CoA thiolase [Paracoccaceae bacterium]MBV03576.1 3-oxoadipyl-CoA thiolase [Paracoccaceae bacterium]MDG1880444.1 3-oxoadipyl-CoA thiolase [Paracoccaceae bacterium]MDG1939033.1 3-oxoadipyl-CoA thiolase [Paracoccaceae bacterium]|tara:strand:- start:6297 stop:7496 length:1200 start_codon:yes stop_codon:yes gene_type:complete